MHWEEGVFALPKLPENKKWYRGLSTNEGVMKEVEMLENQQKQVLLSRKIAVFVGKR